jgi:hypothetical protein
VVIDAADVREMLAGKIITLPAPPRSQTIELAGGDRPHRAQPEPKKESTAG